MAKENEIRLVAYNIWEQEGRPAGKDVEHYLRAKKILEEREAKQVAELGPPPKLMELEPSPKPVPSPQQRRQQSMRARHKKK